MIIITYWQNDHIFISDFMIFLHLHSKHLQDKFDEKIHSSTKFIFYELCIEKFLIYFDTSTIMEHFLMLGKGYEFFNIHNGKSIRNGIRNI